MTPACFVISAAELNAALEALGIFFYVCLAAVFAAGVDWWRLDDRFRAHARRRRLRAIRRARAFA